jgi:hypothetical protein
MSEKYIVIVEYSAVQFGRWVRTIPSDMSS